MGLLAVVLLAMPGMLAAQAPPAARSGPGTINGSGTGVIVRRPEFVRLQMDLLARGKDLKEALEKLKDRREAARLQVTQLGAEASSILFSDAAVMESDRNEQMQMQRMMLNRVRRGRSKAAKKPEPKQPVTVAAALRADFPIKQTSSDAVLVLVAELKEKLVEADVSGAKELEKGTEKEELTEEEEEMMMQMSYSSDQQPPGEPNFIYVARISDQDQSDALAQAFTNARRHAERMAKAAGVGLGALRSLERDRVSQYAYDSEDESAVQSMLSYRRDRWGSQRPISFPIDPKSRVAEATGSEPREVRYSVHLSASFDIQ
jgi:hypothetical protein